MNGENPFLLPGTPARAERGVTRGSGTRRESGIGEERPQSGPADGAVPADPAEPAAPTHPAVALTAAAESARWRIILPDGVEIPLDRPALLGRDPSVPEGVCDARAIAVRDPQQTVSKTHALLSPEPGGIRVRDLHSTNGTTLVLAAGRVPVPTGGDLLATPPAELLLGRFAVRLDA